MSNFLESAQRTIDIEAAAVSALKQRIDTRFHKACELLLDCRGRVVVTGMGKSGHIARKIAATLASTGTPAFFVHPGEAGHGDSGMITADDVVIALSNSGKTPELITLLPLIKRLNATLISLTGNHSSILAEVSTVNLDVSVDQEACPLGLAPTSSTTAALVMGDAIAIALLEARGFTAEDFAFAHPGGSLGRRLLLKVADIMRQGPHIPIVKHNTLLKDALLEITQKGLGMTAVVSANQQLMGVFTDGDLRRVLDKNMNIHQMTIEEVMTRGCKTISALKLAVEALKLMEDAKINALIVVDNDNHPIGALNMHDLLQSGVL